MGKIAPVSPVFEQANLGESIIRTFRAKDFFPREMSNTTGGVRPQRRHKAGVGDYFSPA
jgi:hypothetical protein